MTKFNNISARQLTNIIQESLKTLLNTATVHPDDEIETVKWLYLHRLFTDYRAFILLADEGMLRQSQILMRCMLEIVFEMVAWQRHPDLHSALINGDDSDRRQVLENLLTLQKNKATLTEKELNRLQEMVKSPDEMDRKSLPTFIKAEFADLLQLYRTDYQLLSETVHSETHDIKADIIKDLNNEQLLEIHTLSSNQQEMDELLLQTAGYVLAAYESFTKLSGNKLNSVQYDDLHQQLQQCWHRQVSPVPHKK
ncbi:MAG: DUF5677 domain-containing protein [Methylophaga sp.]|nr:DUF5677 domain-containing protein [Methylophaga sp.]